MPLSIERIASRARFNGRPIADLAEPPSAYLRRQIRVASFGFERPAQLARQAGDIFMFGSDYPHPEGNEFCVCPGVPLPPLQEQ